MNESGWAFGESIIALIEPVQPSTMIMRKKHYILHQFISLSSLASMAQCIIFHTRQRGGGDEEQYVPKRISVQSCTYLDGQTLFLDHLKLTIK